jgi:hypothetical protein
LALTDGSEVYVLTKCHCNYDEASISYMNVFFIYFRLSLACGGMAMNSVLLTATFGKYYNTMHETY